MIRRVVLWVVVVLGATAAVSAAEPDSPLETAKRLAASADKPERIQALQALKSLTKPGTAPGDEALARYGDLCLRFLAEGEKAGLEEARRAFIELKEKSHSRWGLKAKVGLMRVAAAEGKREEAIKGLDWFLSNQGQDDAFIEGAYYLGGIYAQKKDDLKDLQLALGALDYSLKLLAQHRSYYAGDLTEEAIRGKLGWVNERIREIKTGPLKLTFERAEGLKEAGKYDEAIKLYEWVTKEEPAHNLAQISGLRICQCLFLKKDLQGAIARAQVFVAANPLGPYRGHAHLLIGDIRLEHLFDVPNAEPEFRCILEPEKAQPAWLEAERRKLPAVPGKGGQELSQEKSAGSTWNEVWADAHDRLGIIEYVRRGFDKAADHFDTSSRLRPVKGLEREPVGMAEVAELCRKKQMPLDEALLGEGDERSRFVLFLGSVYSKGWKDDRAFGLFDRVYRNEFGGATANQRAYARARQGAGWLYKGETEKALAVYTEIEKDFRNTPYAADALLQHASCVSRTGKTREAATYLEACYTRYPDTAWADWALYQRAFVAFNHESAPVAKAYFSQFLARYPKSSYASGANRFIKELDERINKGKVEPEGIPLEKMEGRK